MSGRSTSYGLLALTGVALAAAATGTLAAPAPFSARAGLELAEEAAAAWAADARLIYVENNGPVDGAGAERWGYLFASRSKEGYRVYSLENGKIRLSADLDFVFDAPALPASWIDSGEAYLAAEEGGGARYRAEQEGALGTLLLVRGLLSEGDPDAPTWAAVYTSPRKPPLFVVIDAVSGDVIRTWRG